MIFENARILNLNERHLVASEPIQGGVEGVERSRQGFAKPPSDFAAIKDRQAGASGESALEFYCREIGRMLLNGQAPLLGHGKVCAHQGGEVNSKSATGRRSGKIAHTQGRHIDNGNHHDVP